MILPSELKEYAKQHKEENAAFRIFLRENADPKELDQQFKRYHSEIFAEYNCDDCMNCCKELTPLYRQEELEKLAKEGEMEVEDLLELCERVDYDAYQLLDEKSCPFMTEHGCKVASCKPEHCKEFPYTDQPDRKESLLGMLSFLPVCPVLYEIYDRLKKDYNFKYEE